MKNKKIQIIIAIKRTIRKLRYDNSVSAKGMRELERVLRNIKVNRKEPAAPQQNRPSENNYSLIIAEPEDKVNGK